MYIKKQIESVLDTALRLCLYHGKVYHGEAGIRGGIADMYSAENPALPQDILESFWSQMLCSCGNIEDVQTNSYCTPGFSFESAAQVGPAQCENEEELEGIAFSVIYGNSTDMETLGRLIAAPVTKYLRQYAGRNCGRLDSYHDTAISISEWMYIIYEIGIKADDPNLKRWYRLITPLSVSNSINEEMLVGYSDCNRMCKKDFPNPKHWELLWRGAERNELAYSKLGTDLFLASRIALDYLLAYDFKEIANEFEQKWRKRTLQSLTDTEIFALSALNTDCLTGEEIAKRAGYLLHGSFRTLLSNLWKRMILEKNERGYFISPDALWILEQISKK